MGKINLFIAGANNSLEDKKQMIKRSVKIAEDYAFSRLKINWDIDVVITNRIYEFIIPEDGVGGRTYTSDFIIISIDENKITEDILSEMLVHELFHAARWGKNRERMHNLFDGVINEGLATCFEAAFVEGRDNKQHFLKTVTTRSEKENLKIESKLKSILHNERYDYQMIFFDGNNDLPRWSGYSLGFFIVKKYLKKTGKTIEESVADKYIDVEKTYYS